MEGEEEKRYTQQWGEERDKEDIFLTKEQMCQTCAVLSF